MLFSLVLSLGLACKASFDRPEAEGEQGQDSCQEQTWYADFDQDGAGAGAGISACDAPAGHVSSAGDCDDTDPFVYPSAAEVCDGGLDNDCDGLVDDADDSLDPSTAGLWFADHDGDGFGDFSESVQACLSPSGFVADTGSEDWDCDDGQPLVNPGQREVCGDGLDNDCSGGAPECALSGTIPIRNFDVEITGAGGEELGSQVVLLDSDGDGRLELVTSSPMASDGGPTQGRALLFAEPFSAYETSRSAAWTSDYGDLDTERGFSMAALPDPEGSGQDALVVGMKNTRNASVNSVEIYLGSSKGLSSSPDITLGATENGDGFGHHVGHLGALLDSSELTLAVGAPTSDLGQESGGAVFLWSGLPEEGEKADVVLTGTESQLLGYQDTLTAGDLDGDGHSDLALGTLVQDRVVLCMDAGSLPEQASTQDCVASIQGEPGSLFGMKLRVVDLNADGYGDLVTSAPFQGDEQGQVSVFLGASGEWSAELAEDADQTLLGDKEQLFTASLESADLNQDGLPDLAIGDAQGKVFVFYSPVDLNGADPESAELILSGSDQGCAQDMEFGDLNGDAIPDTVLGCPQDQSGDGSVQLLFGLGM